MTGPLFASRLEVVNNIRSLARLICRSRGDERLKAHDMQRRNRIIASGNFFGGIGDWSRDQQRHSGQLASPGVSRRDVCVAVCRERNEWRGSNFRIFPGDSLFCILPIAAPFLIRITPSWLAKCAACARKQRIIEHRVDLARWFHLRSRKSRDRRFPGDDKRGARRTLSA